LARKLARRHRAVNDEQAAQAGANAAKPGQFSPIRTAAASIREGEGLRSGVR